MIERVTCNCSICEIEDALLAELSSPQSNCNYQELVSQSPILSSFPSAAALVEQLRSASPDDDHDHQADEVLSALLRTDHSWHAPVRSSIVLLILMPAVHKTARQIAVGFPALARDEIAQTVVTSLLEILQSRASVSLQSHIPFALTRLMRRRAFRWAIYETKRTTNEDFATCARDIATVESVSALHAGVSLEKLSQRSVQTGLLSSAEFELLTLAKIEGVTVEELARRQGLSRVAIRSRLQRIMTKLRRATQSSCSCQARKRVQNTTPRMSPVVTRSSAA